MILSGERSSIPKWNNSLSDYTYLTAELQIIKGPSPRNRRVNTKKIKIILKFIIIIIIADVVFLVNYYVSYYSVFIGYSCYCAQND